MFLPPDRLRPAFMFLNKTSALGGAPWCPLHRLATVAELVGLCHLSGWGWEWFVPSFHTRLAVITWEPTSFLHLQPPSCFRPKRCWSYTPRVKPATSRPWRVGWLNQRIYTIPRWASVSNGSFPHSGISLGSRAQKRWESAASSSRWR